MKKYDAFVAGYTCIDMIPDFIIDQTSGSISDLLRPGKLIEIGRLNFVLGGAVPNTGLALKKFNKKVFLNGLIGDDSIGKIAKEYLCKYDISEGIASTRAAGTAYSIVLAPPGIDRIFLESPGCNEIFDTSFINFNVVSQSRVFHFGYPPLLRQFFLNNGHQLSQMFSRVQQMGILTSLDFSLPDPESESGKIGWPEILLRTLPFVDVFIPSLEEILWIMMPEKYAEICSHSGNSDITNKVPISLIREVGKLIIDSGVKILVIKSGERGAYLLTGNVASVNRKIDFILNEKDWNYREFWCNAYNADASKIINASGAGDVANAAFLGAILNGETPELALKFAALAGRNNLYCHNIYSDLHDWQSMEEEIKDVSNDIIYF